MQQQSPIEWFESLCGLLVSSPREASKLLEEFRDSDAALEVCKTYLESASNNQVARFQAISILQYTIFCHWDSVSKDHHLSYKHFIGNLLNVLSFQSNTPPFILNKTMQVYVSIWKRGWLENTPQENDLLFQQVGVLISDHEKSKIGAILLRYIIEEFSNRSFAETNIYYSFHVTVKKKFESIGINKIFLMAITPTTEYMKAVIQLLSNENNQEHTSNGIKLLTEYIKLLNEILAWDFNTESNDTSSFVKATQFKQLPQEWSTFILQPDFINLLFTLYGKNLLLTVQNPTNPLNLTITPCQTELRHLVLALSSLNGTIFNNKIEDKITFGDNILVKVVEILQNSGFLNVLSGNLTIQSEDYEEGGVKFEEYEFFIGIFSKLLGNFTVSLVSKMSNFEQALVSLSKITIQISQELDILAKFMLNQVNELMGKGLKIDKIKNLLRSSSDIGLIDCWRGLILYQALDCWGFIINDPIMNLICHSSLPKQFSPTEETGLIVINSESFQTWFYESCKELFNVLYSGFFHVLLVDSLITENEEEDEEKGWIESRGTEDFYTNISVIGRICFFNSLTIINQQLGHSIHEFQQLLLNIKSISIQDFERNDLLYHENISKLEKIRINILFLNYLFYDDFHEISTEMSNEAPIINSWVLHSLRREKQGFFMTQETIKSIVNQVIGLEIELLRVSGDLHPSVSPFLLETVFRFLTEYFRRFWDPDQSLYSPEDWQFTPALQMFHGDELLPTVELIFQAMLTLFHLLPLETFLIRSLCECGCAIATSSRNPQRLSHSILTFPVTASITHLITANPQQVNPQQEMDCRFNSSGFIASAHLVGLLFVKAENGTLFTQLCSAIFELCQGQDLIKDENLLSRIISSLTGIARCPSGQDLTLHGLFDAYWPILKKSVSSHFQEDDILVCFLLLLNDYAENQLSRLSNQSCFGFYKVCYEFMVELNDKRFIPYKRENLKNQQNNNSKNNNEKAEESLGFQQELCLLLLQLLNHLSTKEFSFFEDSLELQQQSFELEVSSTLLFGLHIISPLLSTDTLRYFPEIAEKFFSFVSFVLSVYMEQMVNMVNSGFFQQSEEIKGFFGGLIKSCLLGLNRLEVSTARSALQALQSIAVNQFESLKQKTDGFHLTLHTELILPVLDKILLNILLPQDHEEIISMDRVDSVGQVLISFIAVNPARFHEMANHLISRQKQKNSQVMIAQCLNIMVSSRDVRLDSIDRKNRMNFVQNFREFMQQIKSISLQ